MTTLIKRVIFVIILLSIIYGIYRLIDKKWASELKETVVNTTEKTVESFGLNEDDIEEIFNPTFDVVVTDPEIKEPITTEIQEKPKATITKINTKKTNTYSPNILFQLFR